MMLSDPLYKNIRRWMYRNARPIDLARWRFHFEGGPAEDVLRALEAYQNADGGFAHAIEADSWNPESSPLQTWCAAEILREIDFCERGNPLIQGILRYLDSGSAFRDGKWASDIESNNSHPHAFWWTWSSDSSYDYNPTASLAGFALKYAEKGSRLHRMAAEIAEQAAASFMERDEMNDGHLLLCFLRLREYCAECGETGLFDMEAYGGKLTEHIRAHLIAADIDWCCDGVAFGYIYAYKANPERVIEPGRADEIARTLISKINPDGVWDIPWSWDGYAAQWAVSENWWKACGAVTNMLFLKRNGFADFGKKLKDGRNHGYL